MSPRLRGLLNRAAEGGRLVLRALGVLSELAVDEDDVVVEVCRFAPRWRVGHAVLAVRADLVVLVRRVDAIEEERVPAVRQRQHADVRRRDLAVEARSRLAERGCPGIGEAGGKRV